MYILFLFNLLNELKINERKYCKMYFLKPKRETKSFYHLVFCLIWLTWMWHTRFSFWTDFLFLLEKMA